MGALPAAERAVMTPGWVEHDCVISCKVEACTSPPQETALSPNWGDTIHYLS